MVSFSLGVKRVALRGFAFTLGSVVMVIFKFFAAPGSPPGSPDHDLEG